MSSSSIIFHIAEYPTYGYVSILPTNLQASEEDSSNLRLFSQALMNENRVIYVQSVANQTNDQIVFNVTNGIVWLYNIVLKIEIIPERLYLGSNMLSVNEGGTATISRAHLFIQTEYYKSRVTDYVILEEPKHGCVQIDRRCIKMHGFSHKKLDMGLVQYAHDGSEELVDEITVTAIAGQKRSIPVTIHINILPVNDQKPRLVNNTGLTMWEGGVAVITNCMLGKFHLF